VRRDRDPPVPAKAGYLPVETVCPVQPDGPSTWAWLEVRLGRKLATRGPAWRFHELLGPVRQALARPDVILPWTAIAPPGWCYACQPRFACRRDGRHVPPPGGMVFVVFLTARLVVRDWSWWPADPLDPALPARRTARLGEPAWRRMT